MSLTDTLDSYKHYEHNRVDTHSARNAHDSYNDTSGDKDWFGVKNIRESPADQLEGGERECVGSDNPLKL